MKVVNDILYKNYNSLIRGIRYRYLPIGYMDRYHVEERVHERVDILVYDLHQEIYSMTARGPRGR